MADHLPGPTWRLGTIGFSYDDWAGSFYPPGLKPHRRLAWYAQRFPTIELDTTFYATPRPGVIRNWAEATPDGFRFAVKAPRGVTHDPGLADAAVSDKLRRFVDAVRGLGEKLGVVLLQFPAGVTAVRYGVAMTLLLEAAPRGVSYAVEWRHGSWWTRRTVRWLRELNDDGRRVALVGADYPTPDAASLAPEGDRGGDLCRPPALVHTGELAYLRWVGNHGQLPRSDAEVLDPTPRLRWWADRLEAYRRPAAPLREVYGVFGNSYAGHAPATCRRFARLAGLAEDARPAEPLQPVLFNRS